MLQWDGRSSVVDQAKLDECQSMKALDSKSTIAIGYFKCDPVGLVTATPIPWSTTDLDGLLDFIQNHSVNSEVMTLLVDDLADPYEIDPVTSEILQPELERFCYSLCSFQRYVYGRNADERNQATHWIHMAQGYELYQLLQDHIMALAMSLAKSCLMPAPFACTSITGKRTRSRTSESKSCTPRSS
ncbi:hypothetical protein K505DRAFT_339677 [Melanomma pulvis-pyrius CBS 109.77]|uniref:Uncharacterized protein n=1 Tax=Melanomma pulvis-pyrius CBS 109.77 TaxID=1314802 RepID=A0A6A6X574_9PLEO|nr:hypothetical protein K505DRAFT_339677 [Melanomma pulvis-pyrius CBS 109.77]